MFMNNADKVILSQERCCPSHRFPHVWPWQPLVDDEPCHVHVNLKKPHSALAQGLAAFRRCHHNPYCLLLQCPHYAWMCEQGKAILARKKEVLGDASLPSF